jgi:hypothetical protein
MKEEDNNNTERTSKSVYIAIPAEDYEKLAKAAKANCRSIGGELLYGWKRNHERESCK